MSARDFMTAGFASNSYAEAEDADPRVGLVNLADVMLVFACGLMLALVTYWNLDVSTMTEVVEAGDMTEVSENDIEEMSNQTGSGNSFNELGMVYQDPMTGKMYMITEDLESATMGEETETEAETGTSDGTAEGE